MNIDIIKRMVPVKSHFVTSPKCFRVLKGRALRRGGGEQQRLRCASQGETSPFFTMINKGIDIANLFIYIKKVIRKSP